MCLFVQEWARNTGRWSEGDPAPYFAQLKTRLRCAFNKAPDIEEMKELHARNCEEPYKVYRFTTRKGQYFVTLLRLIVTSHRASTSTRCHFSFGTIRICSVQRYKLTYVCVVIATKPRAPIANLPSSAQLVGTAYHSPSYIWVPAVGWECGEGQSDRHTDGLGYASREM